VISPSAPYLILAGDIGRLIDYDSYLSYLATQTAQFEHVFLVLGNHEFYGLSFTAGLECAQRLEEEAVLNGKLVLLHQRRFDIPYSDSTILGCTLWSKIPDDAREVVRMKVKDFERIEGWMVDDHNTCHEADLAWLWDQMLDIQRLNKSVARLEKARRVLVVTHHAPLMQETSSLKNFSNPWSSAFATDLLDDGRWGGVKVWVFGHTHFTTQFEKHGIKVLSNQRGYVLPGSKEDESETKDRKKVFDVRKVVRV
jgi:hypothetical protein